MKASTDAQDRVSLVTQGGERDPHSFSEPRKFRLRHVDLDLSVSFESRLIEGAATLEFERFAGAGDVLVLDSRDLEIHSIEGSGDRATFVPLAYRLEPRHPILGSALRIQVAPGHRFVRIAYATSPGATGLQWLEPPQTASRRFPFLFTQSPEIHARSWFPVQDTPAVRLTFSARIRTPEHLFAVMGADNESGARRTGCYRFHMSEPIPAYLVALAVGDIDFLETGPRTGVYAEPPLISQAAREFVETEHMLRSRALFTGKPANGITRSPRPPSTQSWEPAAPAPEVAATRQPPY